MNFLKKCPVAFQWPDSTLDLPAFANAQAVLARFCPLKPITRCSVALANTSNVGAFDSTAVAKAHAVLDSC